MTTMSLRRRRPGYHQAAGRALVVAGALVAGSALWMTLMYPQEGTGDVLCRRPQPAVVGAQP
jgi:hypothetical protein